MKQIRLSKKAELRCKQILEKYKPESETREGYIAAYEKFSKKKDDAYGVSKLIGVSVCPYCNEQYISTADCVCRPEFDHFLPKTSDRYYMLSLDLYNLVPSCHRCNSNIKRADEFDLENYINPYKEDFDSALVFSIDLTDAEYLLDNFKITLIPRCEVNGQNKKLVEKARNNAKKFEIEERYSYHKDVVVALLKKIKFYNSVKGKEEILGLLDAPNSNLYFLRCLLFPEENCDINSTVPAS